MAVIFISYSRKDSAKATRIVRELESLGHKVNFDTKDIKGGADWQEWIEDSIRAADYVIVMWSVDAAKSDWVNDEIRFARNESKRIIPVLLDDEPLNLSLIGRQPLDGRNFKPRVIVNEINIIIVTPQAKGNGDPTAVQPEYAGVKRQPTHRVNNQWGVAILGGILATVLGGLILMAIAREGPFTPTAIPTPTQPILTVTFTPTTTDASTYTPTATGVPSETPNEFATTAAPVITDTGLISAQNFSLESLNDWRVTNGFGTLAENSILTSLAGNQLSRVSNLSLPDLTATPTAAYIDRFDQNAQQMANAQDYNGQVILMVWIGDQAPTVIQVREEIERIGGGETVHTQYNEIGFSQRVSLGANKHYLVIFLGRR